MRLDGLFLVLLASASCGYRPVHQGGREPLAVVLHESKVADAVASDEVLAGAREEFARRGGLAAGSGFPRCEIEVLRADEASEGIGAVGDGAGRLAPEARATRVGLVARAWVVRAAGGERVGDTGDVRVFETTAVAPDAVSSAVRSTDALRAAGRRLGKRLAGRIMGFPAPTDD